LYCYNHDNIKACGNGKIFKLKYESFSPSHQNFKSGFGFRLTHSVFKRNNLHLTYPLQMERWQHKLIFRLANTTICNWKRHTISLSQYILTYYWPKFNLILYFHHHSPFCSFNSTFPHTVALRTVKQTCELYLSNSYKQTGIVVFKRNLWCFENYFLYFTYILRLT
jgi:hypothetical protein